MKQKVYLIHPQGVLSDYLKSALQSYHGDIEIVQVADNGPSLHYLKMKIEDWQSQCPDAIVYVDTNAILGMQLMNEGLEFWLFDYYSNELLPGKVIGMAHAKDKNIQIHLMSPEWRDAQ